MRYAKLINGAISYAPRSVLFDGNWIGNPPADVLEELGYKPVRYTEPPTVETGYIAVPGWEETETEIVQTWTVEEEPDEIDERRAYRIITGEEE